MLIKWLHMVRPSYNYKACGGSVVAKREGPILKWAGLQNGSVHDNHYVSFINLMDIPLRIKFKMLFKQLMRISANLVGC